MVALNREQECAGAIGTTEDGNEAIVMSCRDGTDWSFVGGDREDAEAQARRVLNRKGYNADLVEREVIDFR